MYDIFLSKTSMMDGVQGWGRVICILLPLIFLLTYSISLVRGILTVRNKKDGSLPPTVPYAIPLLRHLPSFMRNREGFLGKAIVRYGAYTPVRIHILNKSMTLLSGPKNMLTLFRNSRDLANDHWQIEILVSAFGLPEKDAEFLRTDDTGINVQPNPNSTMTVAEHRIWYISHHTHLNLLSGSNLESMAKQLVLALSRQFLGCKIDSSNWTEFPDLHTGFIRKEIFRASMTALCGAHIFEIIPTLDEDFWTFDHWLPDLFHQMPRFLVPDAYRAREKMKSNIKKWHDFANQHYDVTEAEDDKRDWEEFFGSRIMRVRQNFLQRTPITADGRAADDVGLIWGTNANAIPAACWCILDVIQRPDIYKRVMDEISSCITLSHDSSGPDVSVDIAGLCTQPLLQSIYAETLRLRTGVIVSRVPTTSNFTIDGWHFPKDEPIMASNWFAGRDTSVWNTGTPDDPHPLNKFWPDRFLVYPDNPNSGPIKNPSSDSSNSTEKSSQEQKQDEKHDHTEQQSKPTFSLANTGGIWFPYGGGTKMCPGRHFAKQEILVAIALFLTTFEIELLMSPEELEAAMTPDQRYFMFGVMPPAGKFKARVRRRKL